MRLRGMASRMSWLRWIPYFVELLRRKTNMILREMYEHLALSFSSWHCITTASYFIWGFRSVTYRV